MIKRSLLLTLIVGFIFLSISPAFSTIDKANANLDPYLTQEEQKRLPLLIALSLNQQCPMNTSRISFIEGLKSADLEKTAIFQENLEVRIYNEYISQIAIDSKIAKNFEISTRYLQQQLVDGAIPLIDDKICYKIIKFGDTKAIDNNTDGNIKINFTIKDAEGNFLAGNYALSGPLSCTLSALMPGMTLGMQDMRLHEIREIYLHPEFAYGAFSNFANGRAVVIKVELLSYTPTTIPFHPSFLPIDLVKRLPNSSQETTLASLQNAYSFYCGKKAWSFYKQKFPELSLDDLIPFLDSDITLSPQDLEILLKLQWIIYFT